VKPTIRQLALALAVAVCATWPASAPADTHPAREADAFVDSVGVNTHLHYQGTVYDTGFESIIRPKLLASGIRHVRDGAYTYAGAGPDTFYYQRCRELAAAGIRFDLLTGIQTMATDATDYSRLPEVEDWCGGAVESFEGANEPDAQTIPAGQPDWVTQTIQGQQALYAAVRGSPQTWQVAVLGPAVAWSPQALGDLSPYLDYGNWHPYPGGDCPGCGDVYGQTLDTWLPAYMGPSGDKPMVASETGYNNAVNAPAGGNRPVSELAAGAYIPRLLLEDFNRGIARTYLYELIDVRPNPGADQPDANFGLLRNDGSEKPAYRAVQSLLWLLDDPGPAFAPAALDYALTGDTDQVHSTLLQKRDGRFFLALWLERSTYDTGARPNAADDVGARRDLRVHNQRVTITFGTPVARATVHRLRTDGTLSSQRAPLNAGALSFDVTTRTSVVELTVAGPQASAGATALLFARRTGTSSSRTSAPPRLERVRVVQGRRTALRFVLSEAAAVHVTLERIWPRPRRVWRLHVHAARGSQSLRIPGSFLRHSGRSRFRARVVAVDALGAHSRARTVTWRSMPR
jgi:hypothetical protein